MAQKEGYIANWRVMNRPSQEDLLYRNEESPKCREIGRKTAKLHGPLALDPEPTHQQSMPDAVGPHRPLEFVPVTVSTFADSRLLHYFPSFVTQLQVEGQIHMYMSCTVSSDMEEPPREH